MAFVVEDGTGKVDANSYASVAEFKAYLQDRGNANSLSMSDNDIKTNLVLATDYLDDRFGSSYVGTKYTTEQALEWPRGDMPSGILEDVSDEDLEAGILNYIPKKLKEACIEYANRIPTQNPLAPDPTVDAAGVSMVTIEQKIGPIEKKMQPVGGYSASVQTLRAYPSADMKLRGLVYSSNRVIHA